MKVKEVIGSLQEFDPETECIMAINQNSDVINYYPIEDVFGITIDGGEKEKPRWRRTR